jgi:D-tyrosyl-tRNA(Tyr) deacylase
MRLVLQRVSRAAVEVDGQVVGAIGAGLLVLAGVEAGDGEAQVEAAAEKLLHARVFDDGQGRMGRDLADVGGAILLVSQFTLVADTGRGRRPSFDRAAPAPEAARLIERLAARLRDAGARVECGRFGARMRVSLVNEGPVTLVLDLPAAPSAGGVGDGGLRASGGGGVV